MDVQHRDHRPWSKLVTEVLGFLGKEASLPQRHIGVNVEPRGCTTIQSDRGQLQQVFLNIINNALAAVDNGGRIDIDVARARCGRRDWSPLPTTASASRRRT